MAGYEREAEKIDRARHREEVEDERRGSCAGEENQVQRRGESTEAVDIKR